MAAAVLESFRTTNMGAAGDPIPVLMPATVGPGWLLLMFVGWATAGDVNATPSGWTSIQTKISNGASLNLANLVGFAKIADGSEDGATVNVDMTASEDGSAVVYAFSGDVPDIADIQVATAVGTADADPPSLTLAEGAGANWFIAIAVLGNNEPITAGPSGYTAGAAIVDAGVDHAFHSAHLQSGLATQNPGIFNYTDADVGDSWVAFTVGLPEVSGATPVEIAATVATIASSAIAAVPDPEPLTISATQAAIASSAIAQSLSLAAKSTAATPATIASSAIAQALDLGPLTVTGTQAEIAAQAIIGGPIFAVEVEGSPAILASEAVAAVPTLTPTNITGSPALLDITALAQVLQVDALSIAGTPAILQVLAVEAVPDIEVGDLLAEPAEATVQAMIAVLEITGVTVTATHADIFAEASQGAVMGRPPGETAAFYRRRFQGNRPVRRGWKRPPSWR